MVDKTYADEYGDLFVVKQRLDGVYMALGVLDNRLHGESCTIDDNDIMLSLRQMCIHNRQDARRIDALLAEVKNASKETKS